MYKKPAVVKSFDVSNMDASNNVLYSSAWDQNVTWTNTDPGWNNSYHKHGGWNNGWSDVSGWLAYA